RFALLEHAATPRTNEEVRDFAEAWVAEHPGEIDERELDAQRALSWRPIYRWSALTRVPGGGVWGPKAPADHRGAPAPPGSDGAPRLEHAAGARPPGGQRPPRALRGRARPHPLRPARRAAARRRHARAAALPGRL